MTVVAAVTRSDIGDYVAALIGVYTLIIIVYIVTSMLFTFGVRMPYHRWSDAVLSFLRDVHDAVPGHLPALHPDGRSARSQPDRGDHRPPGRSAASSST